MAALSPNQLEQARRYIERCGSGKNPISLLMELGQQLHQAPTFDVYEPRNSSVHQHIFVCHVGFFDFEVKETGYNKKKVKTEAAKLMVEKIYGTNSADFGSHKVGVKTTAATAPEQKPPSRQFQSRFARVGKAKQMQGGLLNSLGMGRNDWSKPHTVESKSHANKEEMVQSRLGLRALDYHLERFNLAGSRNEGDEDIFTDASAEPPLSDSPNSSNPGSVTTAMERLRTLSQEENFTFVFHDLESNENLHLCLVEAKLKKNFVCHGKGENGPQARENAAENILFVVNFFKQKPE